MPSVLEGGEKIKFKKITFCGGVIPFAIFLTASWLLAMKHQHSYTRHAGDTLCVHNYNILLQDTLGMHMGTRHSDFYKLQKLFQGKIFYNFISVI